VSAFYVYGVMRAEEAARSRATGVGDAPVEVIEEGSLAALVSEVPGESVPGRARNLTAHTAVLQDALAQGTVLPMRFGVLVPDAEAVRRELLERRHGWLASNLDALEGRVEMSVSALYREDVLMREVVTEERAIYSLRGQIRSKPDAATHFARVRLGELVARAVEVKRATDSAAILDALRPLAEAFALSELLHERMVVNCAFLVARDRLSAFDAGVEQASAARAERMQFKLTGPLPPFSFVGAEEPAWA
jgi:hypothetical protein